MKIDTDTEVKTCCAMIEHCMNQMSVMDDNWSKGMTDAYDEMAKALDNFMGEHTEARRERSNV